MSSRGCFRAQEFERRLAVFHGNALFVREFNAAGHSHKARPCAARCVGAAALLGHRHVALASRGAAPQVALNAFADLTAEEFAAQRLGAHLHGAAARRGALTLRQQGTGRTPPFAPRGPHSPSATRA